MTSIDVAARLADQVARGILSLPEALRGAYHLGYHEGDLDRQRVERARIKRVRKGGR